MSVRVQVILDESEQEDVRREAERQGVSVSAWMREAARERLRQRAKEPRLGDAEALRSFFEERDRAETGCEPDWEEQRALIEGSRRSGSSGT